MPITIEINDAVIADLKRKANAVVASHSRWQETRTADAWNEYESSYSHFRHACVSVILIHTDITL